MLDNSGPIAVAVVCTRVVAISVMHLCFLIVCTEVYIAFMLHNVDAGEFSLKLLCS